MVDEEHSDDPTSVGVHYIRSRHYRTINADGAQFGITPRGAIQFTLFTDQAPLPEYVLHAVTPEGKLGKSIEEVKKEGIVREVAVNVIMDINTAASFMSVFQEVFEKLQKMRGEENVTAQDKKPEEEVSKPEQS
jgi:hypothetical protein